MSFLNDNALKNYPDVLDVKHVKEILMVGKNLVGQLLREGKIKSLRVGRKTIIAKSSVIDYLNALFAAKEEGEKVNE